MPKLEELTLDDLYALIQSRFQNIERSVEDLRRFVLELDKHIEKMS